MNWIFNFSSVIIITCLTLTVSAAAAQSDNIPEQTEREGQFAAAAREHFTGPLKKGLLQILIQVQHNSEYSNLDEVERYVQRKIKKLKASQTQRYASEIEGFLFAYEQVKQKLDNIRAAYERTGRDQSELLHFHIMESTPRTAKKVAYALAKDGLLEAMVWFDSSRTRTDRVEYLEWLARTADEITFEEWKSSNPPDDATHLDGHNFTVLSLHQLGVIDLNSCEAQLGYIL